VFLIINRNNKDSLVINIAGRQRMLIQQMLNETNRVYTGILNPEVLDSTVKVFNSTLNKLINNSGNFNYASDEKIIAKLNRVQYLWNSYRKQLYEIIKQPKNSNALKYIIANNNKLLSEMDSAVKLLQDKFQAELENVKYLFILIGFLTFLIIIIILYFLKKQVINPVEVLHEISERISSGDLNIKYGFNYKNEFDELGKVIEKLIENIKEYNKKLIEEKLSAEKKVKEAIKEEEKKNTYIKESINKILKVMDKVSKGILNIKVDVKKDEDKEIKSLFNNFNFLIDSLSNLDQSIEKCERKTLQLAKAIEEMPTVVVITDIEGKIEYVNPMFTKITGYDFGEVVGQNPRILKSGHQTKEFYENMWNTILNGKSWKGVFRNKKKNGDYYWSNHIIAPIFENGKITHFVAIQEDITLQKELQEKLEISEKKFRTIWESSLDGMVLIDEEGKIVEANNSFFKVSGMRKSEVIGSKFNLIAEFNNDLNINNFKSRFIQRNIERNIETKVKLKNGEEKWLEFLNSFLEIQDKTFLLSIIRDISKKKQMIEKIIEAKEKAEEMNRLKTQFFTYMSHELRTPFVGILGYAQILQEELKLTAHKQMIDGIIRTSRRMLDTLSNILNLTKLEFDPKEMKTIEINVNEVINEVFNNFLQDAKSKGL